MRVNVLALKGGGVREFKLPFQRPDLFKISPFPRGDSSSEFRDEMTCDRKFSLLYTRTAERSEVEKQRLMGPRIGSFRGLEILSLVRM